MSKEPSIRHDYDAKKDRLEITIKHYGLDKKSDRAHLVKHLMHALEKGKGLARANAKPAKDKKRPKQPMKDSKLIQVGD
jgi:hypothetical protein